jgi:hypothetical protein
MQFEVVQEIDSPERFKTASSLDAAQGFIVAEGY